MDNQSYQNQQLVSEKSKGTAAVLCFFFGVLGIHRFYVGKIGTGILWLLTLGLFGIGEIVDFIMILCGSFTDVNGAVLKKSKQAWEVSCKRFSELGVWA